MEMFSIFGAELFFAILRAFQRRLGGRAAESEAGGTHGMDAMAGRPRSQRATPVEPQPLAQHLPGAVQALERGLGLLAIIAEADGLSLTSIAQRAGIAASTAHRILTTLKAAGFVQCDDARGGYLIGVQAFR